VKDEWLTAEEVAAELRLASVKTLYKWREQRKGPPALKIGRGLRYTRSDVNAWIAEQRVLQTSC